MSCRGVYFALTKNEEARLLAASSDDAVMEIIEEIEGNWDTDSLLEVDKSWDAIHRCLGDGTLNCKSNTSLSRVVLCGKRLCSGANYIISYLTAGEVAVLAREVSAVTEESFRARYFALGQKRLGLYFISDYGAFVSQEDYEYSWSYVTEIRAFFQKSATQHHPILFAVDQ